MGTQVLQAAAWTGSMGAWFWRSYYQSFASDAGCLGTTDDHHDPIIGSANRPILNARTMIIDVSQLQYAPLPNTGNQLERAVIALLKAFFKVANLQNVGPINFYFSNDWQKRAVPLIEVLAHKSAESVPHTRNEAFQVRIEAKWPGANQPGQEQLDSEYNWKTINKIIGVVMAALSQTTINTDPTASRGYLPVIQDALPKVTAALITQAGRALAMDASKGADPLQTKDASDNADMVNFTCDYVEFKGSQRAESDGSGSVLIREIRNFEMRACPSNVD